MASGQHGVIGAIVLLLLALDFDRDNGSAPSSFLEESLVWEIMFRLL